MFMIIYCFKFDCFLVCSRKIELHVAEGTKGQDLYKVFSSYGKVNYMFMDRQKGTCEVEMSQRREAVAAAKDIQENKGGPKCMNLQKKVKWVPNNKKHIQESWYESFWDALEGCWYIPLDMLSEKASARAKMERLHGGTR